jgi:hypothetical protein
MSISTRFLLLFVTLLLSFTIINAQLSAKTHVTPERTQLWFKFNLINGYFNPINHIRVYSDNAELFTKLFVPTNNTHCTLNYDSTVPNSQYLHITMPDDSSTTLTSFEQLCNGSVLTTQIVPIAVLYFDGETEKSFIFSTTFSTLLSLKYSSQPTFTSLMDLPLPPLPPEVHSEGLDILLDKKTTIQQNSNSYNHLSTAEPSNPYTGLPWSAGTLTFDLVLDHELPFTRQVYLSIQNVPQISNCTYTVPHSPVKPTPNIPRLAEVQLFQTTADPSGLYTAVLDLVHTPYFTYKIHEEYVAQYLFNDEEPSTDIPDGWNATLQFSCNVILPRFDSVKGTVSPYVMQFTTTNTQPIDKYSTLTIPIQQPPISMPKLMQNNYVFKLNPDLGLQLKDRFGETCQISSDLLTPICQLLITLALDTNEIYSPTDPTTLTIPALSTVNIVFEDFNTHLFQAIGDCTGVTIDPNPLIPPFNIIKMVLNNAITLVRTAPVNQFVITCNTVTLSGLHPASTTSPRAEITITRDAHDDEKTDGEPTFIPLATTMTKLSNPLTPPQKFQTLMVSVSATRTHYSALQNSWSTDGPHFADAVVQWGRQTLQSTSGFPVDLAPQMKLSQIIYDTGSQRTEPDILTVKTAFYGPLSNIQRLIPIFVTNATTDSPAGIQLKSQLEGLYVDSTTNIQITAETSFYPISANNLEIDYSETDIDCGGPVSLETQEYSSPRCQPHSYCLYDSDCTIKCSSTLDFYQPLVKDGVKDVKQIVRKRVYYSGTCLNSSIQHGMSILIVMLTVFGCVLF